MKLLKVMSKNYSINAYVIAILCGLSLSCSRKAEKEKITSVAYLELSGEAGETFRITIDKDSARLFMHDSDADSVVKTKKITTAEWNKILNSFSLEAFKSVKDGKSNAPVDGRDEIFTITTEANTYRLINGSTDLLRYWRIRGLTKYLLNFRNGKL
jgi:hypothetical protein